MKSSALGLVAIALCLGGPPALAQGNERKPSKGTEIVDKVLPPPVVREYNPPPQKTPEPTKKSGEPMPEVTVRRDGDTTIEEYRIGGKMYKQRVTPGTGAAYTLVDEKGEGKFTRIDGPEPKIAVPMWVLLTW
jgi:hypothetical protein